MKIILGAAGLAVALTCASVTVRADRVSDVEGARANARAGGPTNAHDAELLRRWGATSGFGDWRSRWNRTRADRTRRQPTAGSRPE